MFMVRRTLFILLSRLKNVCAKIIIILLILKVFVVIFLEISNVIPSFYFYVRVTAIYIYLRNVVLPISLQLQSKLNVIVML